MGHNRNIIFWSKLEVDQRFLSHSSDQRHLLPLKVSTTHLFSLSLLLIFFWPDACRASTAPPVLAHSCAGLSLGFANDTVQLHVTPNISIKIAWTCSSEKRLTLQDRADLFSNHCLFVTSWYSSSAVYCEEITVSNQIFCDWKFQ